MQTRENQTLPETKRQAKTLVPHGKAYILYCRVPTDLEVKSSGGNKSEFASD